MLCYAGSRRVISLANSLPNVVNRLYQYFLDGDIKKAVELNKKILTANYVISGKYGVAGVKAAMDIEGYYGGPPRLPLMPLKEEDINNIRQMLKTIDWDSNRA